MALFHMLPEANSIFLEWVKVRAHEAEEAREAAEEAEAARTGVPHVEDDHSKHAEEEGGDAFPLPFVMLFVGYLFVLLIDRVVMGKMRGNQDAEDYEEHVDALAIAPIGSELTSYNRFNTPGGQSCDLMRTDSRTYMSARNPVDSNRALEIELYDQNSDQKHYGKAAESGVIRKDDQTTTKNGSIAVNVKPDQETPNTATPKPESPLKIFSNKQMESNGNQGKQTVCKQKTVSVTTGLMLIIGLGFHAFFEGLAFGLLKDFEDVWKLAIGILIHKTAAAFALGGTLAQSTTSMKTAILYIFIFSILAPIGIIIALIMHTVLEGQGAGGITNLINSCLLSASAGTFLYVGMTEVVSQEFKSDKSTVQVAGKLKKNEWLQFLCIFLGAAVVVGLWFLEGSHEHHVEPTIK